MSSFELNQTADGVFEIVGEMSFDTVAQILKSTELSFAQSGETQVNLSQVDKADSAGLALLLEWKAQARKRNAVVRFVDVPDSLLSIAKTTEVSELIVD